MFDDFKLIPQILLKPSDFFEKAGPQTIGELYKFWIKLSLLSSLMSFMLRISNISPTNSILQLIFGYLGEISKLSFLGGVIVFNGLLSLLIFIFMITLGFLLVLLSGLFFHLFILVFGGKGYNKTLTSVIISSTPMVIFGTIPVVSILVSVYSAVLQIIGVSKLHKFSITKSIIVVLIPMLLLLALMWQLKIFRFSFNF
ncbi:MAG: hypothetical protein GF368_04655 [Candidatus Aenigmarchaeota archaeon]|nr:hypothetical protein [Candidatus Aenigmarchaeota archaeon]